MRFGAPVDSWRLNHLLREERLFATLKEEAAWARPGAGLTELIGLSASTPLGQTVRDNSSRLQMTDTHSENPSIVTADISKWISGESEVFFDLPQTPPSVTADSNPSGEVDRAAFNPEIRASCHRRRCWSRHFRRLGLFCYSDATLR